MIGYGEDTSQWEPAWYFVRLVERYYIFKVGNNIRYRTVWDRFSPQPTFP